MKNSKNIFLFSVAIVSTCLPLKKAFSLQKNLAISHNQPYENATIEKIEIQFENLSNKDSFDSQIIENKLNTKTGNPFSEQLFDDDLKALAGEYEKIEPTVTIVKGSVHITIKIWIPPKINVITWEGNSHVSTNKLQRELKIPEDSVFQKDSFHKRLLQIKEFYIKKGFFQSEVSYTATPVENSNTVNITINIKEGYPSKVDRIIFNGFTSEEKRVILQRIYTQPYTAIYSLVAGTGHIQNELLEQDRLTIVQVLQNEGYADATIDIQIRASKRFDRVYVVITANKGTLFHCGTVSFEGNTFFTDEQIERKFLVHPGEVYSPEALQKTVDAIKNLYGRKGYIDAYVQYEAKLSIDEPIYNVHFQIEEGEKYKIGIVHVLGNERTQTNVILRESLLIPGEIFDSARLKATEQRLKNIGYFKDVNVYAIRSQDDQLLGENYRDVYIEVSEKITGSAGLNFIIGSSGQGMSGGFDVTETNFNYKGIACLKKDGISALRGNGEYLHAKFSVGSVENLYQLSWVNPYFYETDWRVGFDLFHGLTKKIKAKKEDNTNKKQDEKYNILNITSYGFSIDATYPLSPYWAQGIRYRLKHENDKLKEESCTNGKSLLEDTFIISGVSASINYDSTDSIIKPHNGIRSLLEFECAALPPGTVSFFKYSYTNSLYHHLWPHGIIKYKWGLKFIQPIRETTFDTIPYGEKFFLGGADSVRGYLYGDLGPKYPDRTNETDKFHPYLAGYPEGGISYGVVSVEYTHELHPMLDGFLFTDMGAMSNKPFDFAHVYASCGIGIRIFISPQAPFTVGYGHPLTKTSEKQQDRFFFSMSGQF